MYDKLNKTIDIINSKCPHCEEWYELICQISKRFNCLPSYFPDDNSHILKAIDKLKENK